MPSMVGVGLIAVGVIVILLGIRKKKRYSGRTVGKIIGVRESQETDDDGRTSYHYYPQFEYVVNGETYRGEGSTSYSKPQKIQIGGEIEVIYDPKKTEQVFHQRRRAYSAVFRRYADNSRGNIFSLMTVLINSCKFSG